MSVFPQLERELLEVARQRHREARASASSGVAGRGRRRTARRRLPMLLAAAALALVATTVALAAGGVILTGAPVRPQEALNPDVGEGLPARGQSRLLPLRSADPEGGLPWGMRVVHTTRGELCLQVGRVDGGQLGVLGVDGEFGDDGRFHPLPPDALPADVFHGRAFDAWVGNADTTCQLAGEAVEAYHFGVDQGAGPNLDGARRPLRELRDLYFGLLGPQAVSVTYKAGRHRRSVPVVPGVGAYLIVGHALPGQQPESGGSSMGTEGDLAPSPPLVLITYRIDGRLCERVPTVAPWQGTPQVSDPCPWPHFPKGSGAVKNLHRPIQVSLRMRADRLVGVSVSFTAPFAITTAREHYLRVVPSPPCHQSPTARDWTAEAGGLESTAADVAAGQRVTFAISPAELFTRQCPQLDRQGRRTGMRTLRRTSAEVIVFYDAGPGSRTEVGSVLVRRPAASRR